MAWWPGKFMGAPPPTEESGGWWLGKAFGVPAPGGAGTPQIPSQAGDTGTPPPPGGTAPTTSPAGGYGVTAVPGTKPGTMLRPDVSFENPALDELRGTPAPQAEVDFENPMLPSVEEEWRQWEAPEPLNRREEFLQATQGAENIYRPEEGFVTGNEFVQKASDQLTQLTQSRLQGLQERFSQMKEQIRASMASRGLLESGVSAQAEADLSRAALREMGQIQNQALLQQAQMMMQAKQMAVDNAFKLAGLDIDIAKLGMDRQQIAAGLELEDAQFAQWAQNLHDQTGIEISKLYESRNRVKADLAIANAELEMRRRIEAAQMMEGRNQLKTQLAIAQMRTEMDRRIAQAQINARGGGRGGGGGGGGYGYNLFAPAGEVSHPRNMREVALRQARLNAARTERRLENMYNRQQERFNRRLWGK